MKFLACRKKIFQGLSFTVPARFRGIIKGMGRRFLQVLAAFGAAACLFATGCGDGDGGFDTRLVLLDDGGGKATEFSQGETVTFELSVTNRDKRTRLIALSSTLEFDILVAQYFGSPVLWQRSFGVIFSPVLTDMVFSPGETKTFRAEWDQVTDLGEPFYTGGYYAQGFVATAEEWGVEYIVSFPSTPTRSQAVFFTIK